MLKKLMRSLMEDIAPLLPTGIRFDAADAARAFEYVCAELICRRRGDPWKLSGKVIAELREQGYPTLLQGPGRPLD